MARRSRLTANTTNIVGDDNGPVVVSITQATKTAIGVNLNTTQFASLNGFTITAGVVEADNVAMQTSAPDGYLPGAIRQPLSIINRDDANSTFQIYFDAADLTSGWAITPSPGHPVYGFITCVIDDNGTNQQSYEIIRGRIEIVASPSAIPTT